MEEIIKAITDWATTIPQLFLNIQKGGEQLAQSLKTFIPHIYNYAISNDTFNSLPSVANYWAAFVSVAALAFLCLFNVMVIVFFFTLFVIHSINEAKYETSTYKRVLQIRHNLISGIKTYVLIAGKLLGFCIAADSLFRTYDIYMLGQFIFGVCIWISCYNHRNIMDLIAFPFTVIEEIIVTIKIQKEPYTRGNN